MGGVRQGPSVPDPLHGAAHRHRGDRRRRRWPPPRRGALRRGGRRCSLGIVASEPRPLVFAGADGARSAMGSAEHPRSPQVTDCLARRSDGETIMASMGSLGHYMQEMSRDGFPIRDFLHEGNGDIWLDALNGPRVCGLAADRGEGGGRRHAGAHRPRAAGVSRRIQPHLRSCGRGVVSARFRAFQNLMFSWNK